MVEGVTGIHDTRHSQTFLQVDLMQIKDTNGTNPICRMIMYRYVRYDVLCVMEFAEFFRFVRPEVV
jgi:hypothetical protein